MNEQKQVNVNEADSAQSALNVGLGFAPDEELLYLKNGTPETLRTLQRYQAIYGEWPRTQMPITRNDPHPPSRNCPCKDCLPSFEDEA